MKTKLYKIATILAMGLGIILSFIWEMYIAGTLFLMSEAVLIYLLYWPEPTYQYRLYKESNGVRNYYGFIPTNVRKIHNQWVSVSQYSYTYCKADAECLCVMLNCKMEKI